MGDYDGKFTCLDLQSGKELWSFKNEEAELPLAMTNFRSHAAFFSANFSAAFAGFLGAHALLREVRLADY